MDLKGAAMAVLISILWGANTVVIKMGLEEAPPLRLACMRFVVGGVVICLWAWATGRFAGFRVEPAEWRPLVFLGLLFSVQMAATNVGTWLTSAAHASVLLNLYAVHTVVLAHFLIPGDRLTVRRLAGVLVAYSASSCLAPARSRTARRPCSATWSSRSPACSWPSERFIWRAPSSAWTR